MYGHDESCHTPGKTLGRLRRPSRFSLFCMLRAPPRDPYVDGVQLLLVRGGGMRWWAMLCYGTSNR